MSVENETDDTDLPVTPLAHFGREVRLERERQRLSREELGKKAHCGYSLWRRSKAGSSSRGANSQRPAIRCCRTPTEGSPL